MHYKDLAWIYTATSAMHLWSGFAKCQYKQKRGEKNKCSILLMTSNCCASIELCWVVLHGVQNQKIAIPANQRALPFLPAGHVLVRLLFLRSALPSSGDFGRAKDLLVFVVKLRCRVKAVAANASDDLFKQAISLIQYHNKNFREIVLSCQDHQIFSLPFLVF